VGAADTDDFSRWLIARIWHKPKSTDRRLGLSSQRKS
jgi:hypothetical protein